MSGVTAKRVPDSRLSRDSLPQSPRPNSKPTAMPQLTKEDHNALGLELHSVRHRLEGIAALLRERYGPENSATISAEEAQAGRPEPDSKTAHSGSCGGFSRPSRLDAVLLNGRAEILTTRISGLFPSHSSRIRNLLMCGAGSQEREYGCPKCRSCVAGGPLIGGRSCQAARLGGRGRQEAMPED